MRADRCRCPRGTSAVPTVDARRKCETPAKRQVHVAPRSRARTSVAVANGSMSSSCAREPPKQPRRGFHRWPKRRCRPLHPRTGPFADWRCTNLPAAAHDGAPRGSEPRSPRHSAARGRGPQRRCRPPGTKLVEFAHRDSDIASHGASARESRSLTGERSATGPT